jgi:hypothetical protein
MRKVFLLALAVAACSPKDASTTDSADASLPAPPAAPARLTAADVAGTWTGTTMAETTDSVTNRWTSIRDTDSTSKLVFENSKDTVMYSVVYDADSMVATSRPYASPTAPRTQVIFRSVGRMKDGKLVGTAMTTLAAKPDSVVSRGRWEATRKP